MVAYAVLQCLMSRVRFLGRTKYMNDLQIFVLELGYFLRIIIIYTYLENKYLCIFNSCLPIIQALHNLGIDGVVC